MPVAGRRPFLGVCPRESWHHGSIGVAVLRSGDVRYCFECATDSFVNLFALHSLFYIYILDLHWLRGELHLILSGHQLRNGIIMGSCILGSDVELNIGGMGLADSAVVSRQVRFVGRRLGL